MALRCGANPPVTGALEEARREIGSELRRRFGSLDRKALRELRVYRDYEAYYKKYDKSYHVRLQLESVALKGRDVPPISSLVTPMFLAELENGVLTAGHDLDRLTLPVTVRIAREGEHFALLGNQKDQEAREGDQALADGKGLIGTILHGPDHRTRMDETTRNALYVVYGVPGVDAETVRAHLGRIRDLVRLALPEARAEGPEILRAGD
jgi:DNA/RNA-binding domain of Phe-tRNA-synthetase-like protein